MAKGERSLNPVTAHLRSEKARALKKSKNQVAVQRQERLARRNPDRLQKQIDELKATQEAQGGQLRPKDKQTLEQLERDVKAIRKAREAQGGREQNDGQSRQLVRGDGEGGEGGSVLGKRPRDRNHQHGRRERREGEGEDSDTTDEDVRKIPMPRDTPPPIPRRRNQRHGAMAEQNTNTSTHELPEKPKPVAQTVYSSAPQMRNLQKESTAKFVPVAVAARLKQSKGESGRYLEPEEVDKLEQSGYIGAKATSRNAPEAAGGSLEEEEAAFEREMRAAQLTVDDATNLKQSALRDAKEAAEAAEQEAEFSMMSEDSKASQAYAAERALKHVQIEEVEDEDA